MSSTTMHFPVAAFMTLRTGGVEAMLSTLTGPSHLTGAVGVTDPTLVVSLSYLSYSIASIVSLINCSSSGVLPLADPTQVLLKLLMLSVSAVRSSIPSVASLTYLLASSLITVA